MFDGLRQTSGLRDVMALLRASEEQARALGATVCEAEHLLLALVDGPSTPASTALRSLGLTRERITEGLDRELVDALARARVHLAEVPGPRPRRSGGRIQWGESAQRVVERSVRESSQDAGLRILLAVVHAEGGPVPGLLIALGVSVNDVETAVTQADREP